MNSVLFIGGPVNGQLVQFPDELPNVFEQPYILPDWDIHGEATELTRVMPQIIEYTLRKFGIGHLIYAPHWLSNDEVMQALMSAYLRKIVST